MTNPTTLLALAERCEQAAGPDGMLDYEIAWAAGYRFEKAKAEKRKWWRDPKGVRCSALATDAAPPRFTASLDAAVTLVPEGCGHQIISGFDEGGLSHASVYVPEIDNGERGDAATAALALCSAALRARYVKP